MPRVNYGGKVINFPDGTSQEDMTTAMGQLGGAPASSPLVEHPEFDAGELNDRDAAGFSRALDRTSNAQPIPLPTVQPAQARAALGLAEKVGVTPEFASKNYKDLNDAWGQAPINLNGLPRLAAYAGQSPVHAKAIGDDVDNLGVLDWAFGRGDKLAYYPDENGVNALRKVTAPFPESAPGWLLSYGRYASEMVLTMRSFWDVKFGGGEHFEQIQQGRKSDASTKLPGEQAPLGSLLYRGQEVVQNLAPYMTHPAVAFGLMYADGTAHTYEALRRNGYEHQEAADVGETVGFTTAVVGTLLGTRLFGSIFPKTAVGAIGDGVPAAMLRAVSDRPEFWKFARDVGVNQFHAAIMNVGMAATESGFLRAYDAYTGRSKFSLSGFVSDLDRAVRGSFELMPLSIWAGTRSAATRAKLYEEGGPLREFNRGQAESMEVEQRIYDEYERQGLALRSLKAAGDLNAAAEAVQRSKFMQESPEEGKKLIRSMLQPRKTQTVFVDPEALIGLPEQELSALNVRNLAEAMTSGSMAEVPTEDFVTSPSVTSLIKHTQPEAGLMTPTEANKNTDPPPPIDLTRMLAQRDHITANEPDTPERRAKLDALNGVMRAVAMKAPLSDSQWERLGVGPDLRQKEYEWSDREKEAGLPEKTMQAFREAGFQVEEAVKEKIKQPTQQPMLGFRGKLSRERLKAWAAGEVEDRAIGSYDDLSKQHERAADEAEDRAAKLQEQISADLARASGKAKKGVEHGVESGASGREGAGAALSGGATEGAVKNWVDRSLKFGERAEDQGVKAVKEEVKAGDKAKQIPRLQKIARVNDAMAKALKDAREEADEIRSFVGSQDRNAAYRGGFEYGSAHDAITEALGGERGGYAAPDVSNFSNSVRAPFINEAPIQPTPFGARSEWSEKILGVYEKIRSDGFVATFDLKAVNKLIENPRPLDELTLPEARKVKEALEQVQIAAVASTKVRAEGRFQDREVLRDKIIKHLEKLPFMPPGQSGRLDNSDALTLGQKFGKRKAEFQSDLNQPYTIFAKMGPAGDSLWFDGFVPAAAREERLHAAHVPAFEAIVESFPKEIRDTGRDHVPPPPGAGPNWGWNTRGNVWRLVLHLGTESGIKKISDGAGISPASLMSWAQANMARDPAHVPAIMEKFIEPTWKVFDRLWQEYEPALKERGLPPPKKLDTAPFTVGGKTYSGGYGGRLRWMGSSGRPVDPESTAALLGLDWTGPSTPQQHLQERTGAAGIPDLATSGVGASLRSEVHDLAFHGTVESMHRLLSDPVMRRTLDDKIGRQFIDQLYSPDNPTSWLHVVAQGRIPDLNSLSLTSIISNMQGRAAISAFALNARVMLMQGSHELAMAFGMGLNPLPMARSFNSERRAWAEANSQVLRYRQNDFERKNTELIGQLTGVRPGQGAMAEIVPGMGVAQVELNRFNWAIWKELDGRLSHALWEMGLHDGLSRGLPQEEAIKFADKTVQRGMPSQTIYEQSAAVRDRQMFGLMFLVKNFPSTLYNVAALESWDARAAGGSLIKTGAKYLGMVLAAEIIGKGVLGGHLPKDEDPDAWLARNAIRSLFYPLYLDAPAEAVGHMVAGNRREAVRSLEHMTPAAISTGSRFLLNVGDAAAGDDPKAIRAAMDVAGFLTKMPIPALADWIRAGAESGSTPELLGRGAGYIRGDQK